MTNLLKPEAPDDVMMPTTAPNKAKKKASQPAKKEAGVVFHDDESDPE